MPKQFDRYHFRDGITALDAATFNAIFRDVDNRVAALESLGISWEDAVALVTAQGLKRIDAVLQPSLDAINVSSAQANQLVLDLQAELAILPDVATNAALSAAIAAIPVADTSAIESNIALNTFRIAINGSLSKLNMVDGFVDEYADETGIDTANSTNQIYDAATNSYSGITPVGNAVPVMTSATTPSGIASASSEFNTTYSGWKALGTGQWVTSVGVFIGWLAYEFASPKVITSYEVRTASADSAKNWTFEGWNGSAWVILDTKTNQTQFIANPYVSGSGLFSIANTTAYIKYRLNITANNGGTNYLIISKLELNVDVAISNLTLPSTPVTAVAQPTTASLVVLEEDVDAVTLNTDLIAAVSRDGGTTWTNATLSDKGNYKTTPVSSPDIIPTMSSNTAPSGIASSDSGVAWQGFDKNTGTAYTSATIGSGWLAYEFTTAKVIIEYHITIFGVNYNENPKDFTFEGWDGAAWVVLDTQTGQTWIIAGETRVFSFANTAAYIKYRVNISASVGAGNYPAIYELTMHSIAAVEVRRILTASADISAQPAGTAMKYKLTTANAKNLKLHGTALSWK